MNRRGACLGGKSGILVTEQLFLKFILNLGEGGIFNLTCATPETGVRKRMFSLRNWPLWLQLGPFGFTWFGQCSAARPLALGQAQQQRRPSAGSDNEGDNVAVRVAFPTARVVARLCLRSAARGFIS